MGVFITYRFVVNGRLWREPHGRYTLTKRKNMRHDNT